jgi:hypothetical protein
MPSEDESRGIQYEIQCEKDGHERTYLREQLAEAKLYIVNLQETLKLKGAADAVSMPPILSSCQSIYPPAQRMVP